MNEVDRYKFDLQGYIILEDVLNLDEPNITTFAIARCTTV